MGVPEIKRLSRDTYTGTTTSVEIRSPVKVTGVERMMLIAQGGLQRQLSAFFGRSITVERIYTKTTPRGAGASKDHPIHQERQVHLVCGPKVVCVATSSVTVTSPETERLLLDEKFALGQIFRHLRADPEFLLLNVDSQIVAGKRELRRTYLLETEGIRCEILEVFPDRDMFVLGEAWLDMVDEDSWESSSGSSE
ncbi:hypothetical protein K466DRAFT_667806 [Polyporus arcularius HHB13444]|uniref:Uncharacterized protein n=1 Tax=Polyporus arcularius HHB13444 TaxID=1314778 RepID=A0A5C3NRY1_9APHY|nr:hypothetical protein K466DRAFT_667806 [Polyporus arcularius HHB13444]